MENLSTPQTHFAPAERATQDIVAEQTRRLTGDSILGTLLNAVPNIFLILNQQRQIVFANQPLAGVLGIQDIDKIYGKRPGEVLDCEHASETEAGCGTTEFCSTCGAVKAILAAQGGRADVQECHILRRKADALEFRVCTMPFHFQGEDFTFFAVEDISSEKRRRALERIFFHDVLNTATGLQGATFLLRDAEDAEDRSTFQEILESATDRLIEEIKAQRELTAAENNELAIHIISCSAIDILQQVKKVYDAHEVAKGKEIHLVPLGEDVTLNTDPVQLGRVIGNLVKNALEASPDGSAVRISCEPGADAVRFRVHNDTVMPRNVQLQIFQRSFSTKGMGRGLGTYSIKLITERYLDGKVSFTSSDPEGTDFLLEIPLRRG